MSTVLVTGGCGFIGLGLVSRLASLGHRVVVADYLHPQVHPDTNALNKLPASALHQAVDVTHAPSMESIVRCHLPSVVVHLAAETGTGQSLTEASRHAMVNVVGTTNLLDACSRIGHVPDKIVLTSSRAVYGEGAWLDDEGTRFYPGPRLPRDLERGDWNPRSPSGGSVVPLPNVAGSTEPRPTNIYASTKLAQEHLVTSWCAAFEAKARIRRLQNVYGPGQSPTNSYTGVLTFFAVKAARGETIEVFEDGDIGRDFVYVDDVVDELCSAVEHADAPSLMDVGGGQRTTILAAAQTIAAAANAPAPRITGAFRLGDVRSAWAEPIDGRRRTPVDEGLNRLVESFSGS